MLPIPRTIDAFSASLGEQGPSTPDGSPSQGTQDQFNTALSNVGGYCEPAGGPPTNTAVAIVDLVNFLGEMVGTVSQIQDAVETTVGNLGNGATNLATAVNEIAGSLGG
jgi:hypothetical protein